MKKFLVEFHVIHPEEEFLHLIDSQKEAINKLFREGSLLNYTLSKDRKLIWAVIQVESKVQAIKLVGKLPLAEYMDDTIHELQFYKTHHLSKVPSFSMN